MRALPRDNLSMPSEGEVLEAIARLERRVEALEARLPGVPVAQLPGEVDHRVTGQPGNRATADLLSHLGRSLIVLGGAYLLRAITQATLLPELAGVALAYLYAFFWIWGAHRARGNARRALFDGGTGIFIACALAWESSARFHLLDAWLAAAMITAVAVIALIVAVRDDLRELAWIVACGSSAALVALAIGTRELVAPAIALVPIGIVAIWAAARRQWDYLGFAPGVALDLMLIVLAAMTSIGKAPNARMAAAAVSLFALSAYFAAMAWKRETRTSFDTAQLLAVLLIALTGTTVLVTPFVAARIAAGVFLLALAIAAYFQRRMTFVIAAVLLALFGSVLAVQREPATIAWAIAAIVLVRLGHHRQAAAFATASVALSGLLTFALGALFAPVSPSLFTPGIVAIVVFAAIALATALARPPNLVLITLSALGSAAMLVALTIPVITAHAARVATLRTILLAVAALLFRRFAATRALVYPTLILAALKLLVEDFRVGSPATLFLSLAIYGGALVLASRKPVIPSVREGPGRDGRGEEVA
ncbi:MAG TPA: hypothetical protein VNA69_04205 [Thermoanaerobaculia bacterium]|nr:hypothetical protein [Thermoanaerobaculia bacterium]